MSVVNNLGSIKLNNIEAICGNISQAFQKGKFKNGLGQFTIQPPKRSITQPLSEARCREYHNLESLKNAEPAEKIRVLINFFLEGLTCGEIETRNFKSISVSENEATIKVNRLTILIYENKEPNYTGITVSIKSLFDSQYTSCIKTLVPGQRIVFKDVDPRLFSNCKTRPEMINLRLLYNSIQTAAPPGCSIQLRSSGALQFDYQRDNLYITSDKDFELDLRVPDQPLEIDLRGQLAQANYSAKEFCAFIAEKMQTISGQHPCVLFHFGDVVLTEEIMDPKIKEEIKNARQNVDEENKGKVGLKTLLTALLRKDELQCQEVLSDNSCEIKISRSEVFAKIEGLSLKVRQGDFMSDLDQIINQGKDVDKEFKPYTRLVLLKLSHLFNPAQTFSQMLNGLENHLKKNPTAKPCRIELYHCGDLKFFQTPTLKEEDKAAFFDHIVKDDKHIELQMLEKSGVPKESCIDLIDELTKGLALASENGFKMKIIFSGQSEFSVASIIVDKPQEIDAPDPGSSSGVVAAQKEPVVAPAAHEEQPVVVAEPVVQDEPPPAVPNVEDPKPIEENPPQDEPAAPQPPRSYLRRGFDAIVSIFSCVKNIFTKLWPSRLK